VRPQARVMQLQLLAQVLLHLRRRRRCLALLLLSHA
jgi:hypothetical protein